MGLLPAMPSALMPSLCWTYGPASQIGSPVPGEVSVAEDHRHGGPGEALVAGRTAEVGDGGRSVQLFGFRLEMGRDHGGIRMQARRTGFATAKAAQTEYGRLCRQRDAQHPKPRLSDSVQNVCEGWALAREQELEPNTVYGYWWVLGLIYPYVGSVRASRLSARMVERAYRELEGCGYSCTCQRFLNFGSDPLFVIGIDPLGEKDSFAEQIEVGATVHLALDHLDAVNVPFDHS
jgi:hypothetical protein